MFKSLTQPEFILVRRGMFTLTLQASILFELSKMRMYLVWQFKHPSKGKEKEDKA